jgi:hypothetical protein
MSAPRRTPPLSQADTKPISLEASPWIVARQRWLRHFELNRSNSSAASRAWEKLTNAGLENVAHQALWLYAYPLSGMLAKEQKKRQELDRRIKALIRARSIERIRRKAGDPRAGLFFERFSRKQLDLWRAEVPSSFDGSTVGDWMIRRFIAGKPTCDLPELRKVFASLGPRCPISDRKFWLYVLRCYASNAGVPLGAERLVALAHCSDPGSHLDPSSLARTFTLFRSQVDADCREIRNVLPPLPLFPPQNS